VTVNKKCCPCDQPPDPGIHSLLTSTKEKEEDMKDAVDVEEEDEEEEDDEDEGVFYDQVDNVEK
jgi:hypothetical protein